MSQAALRPALRLRHVAKQFSTGALAVDNLNLEVGAGEFVAMLGPSGCGKSTLLRMMAGLIAPTDGVIERPALSVTEPHAIGFVFQEPTLMPWTSALRNVMLPLTLSGVASPEAKARAAAMLALVGLHGFERAYPRQLSGGMRMRVSIARALVTRPRVLLMDEPFAALDEITRHRLNDDLLSLWREHGFTVVFVTHSVFESAYLAQRIVVMTSRPGRIAAEIANAASYPRNAEFRLSPPYAEVCRAGTAALTQAMAA